MGRATAIIRFGVVTVLSLTSVGEAYSLKRPMQWLRDIRAKFINDANTPCLRYSADVLHSGVFNFAPWLELHHVVMLGSNETRDNSGIT
jgi:hypothetical protein